MTAARRDRSPRRRRARTATSRRRSTRSRPAPSATGAASGCAARARRCGMRARARAPASTRSLGCRRSSSSPDSRHPKLPRSTHRSACPRASRHRSIARRRLGSRDRGDPAKSPRTRRGPVRSRSSTRCRPDRQPARTDPTTAVRHCVRARALWPAGSAGNQATTRRPLRSSRRGSCGRRCWRAAPARGRRRSRAAGSTRRARPSRR